MGLKFGQNIKFQFFLRFLQHSGGDKACLSRHTAACRDIGRDILLLVPTSVAMSRHTAACRDIGRDTGRDILLVATYFPCRDILS